MRVRKRLRSPLLSLLLFAACPAQAAELRHPVAPGETLPAICAALSRKPDCALQLQRFNALEDPAHIAPGTVLRVPAELLAEAPIVGGVLESAGEASYRALGAASFAPLVAGEPVYLGDTIRTGEGTALLEFVSGLMILLRPESTLLLDMLSEADTGPLVEVALEHGSMEAATPEPAEQGEAAPATATAHELRAGEATARLEGSARLNAGPAGDSVSGEALRGALQLQLGERVVAVPPGHGWSGGAGQAPEPPTPLLPAPALAAAPPGAAPPVAADAGTADPSTLARASFQRMFEHTPYVDAPALPPGPVDTLAAQMRAALLQAPLPPLPGLPWGHVFRPVSLDWAADPGSVAWQLDLLAVPPGTGGPRSLRTRVPHAELPQLGEGCHVLGLRAIDRRGLAGLERLLPLCVHAPLAAPAARPAARGARVLDWPPVAGAERYAVELAQDRDFARMLQVGHTVNPRFELPAVPAARVFVRVRAINAAGLRGPAGAVLEVDGS